MKTKQLLTLLHELCPLKKVTYRHSGFLLQRTRFNNRTF